MKFHQISKWMCRAGLRGSFVLLGFLIACTGGSGGGAPGASVGEKGNWAAGPMPMPAPASISKDMIYCNNVEGPMVQCFGKPGAVDPNAKVTVKVHPAGYSRRTPLMDLVIPSAYALPGIIATTTAGPDGAFAIDVLAATGERLEIFAEIDGRRSDHLLLTVPGEGGSVSGSSATILAVDPDGNAWIVYHAHPPKAKRTVADRLLSLFVGSAWAAPAPAPIGESISNPPPMVFTAAPLLKFATCPGQEVDRPLLESRIQAISSQGVVRRALSGGSEVVDAVTLPHIAQADINVVRPFTTGGQKYLAVGANERVFILRVTDPNNVRFIQEIRFPYQVEDIQNFFDLYVFLGGEGVPASAKRVYQIDADMANFTATCLDYRGVFDNLEAVVAADGLDDYFLFIGRYGGTKGSEYKVILGEAEINEFMFETVPQVIFTSPRPLAAKFLKSDTNKAHLAILDIEGKRLAITTRSWSNLRGGPVGSDVVLPLGELRTASGPLVVGTPAQLDVSRVRQEFAFLNVHEHGVELVIVPYQFQVDRIVVSGRASVSNLGAVQSSVLARDDRNSRWVVIKADGEVMHYVPPAERFEAILPDLLEEEGRGLLMENPLPGGPPLIR